MKLSRPVLAWACVIGVSCAVAPNEPPAPHHTDDGFRNVHAQAGPGLRDFLKWQWARWRGDVPGPETYDFPLAANDPAYLRANGSDTTLTWIGHATVLLQVAGRNILTDPVFSERASPFTWMGPRRAVAPGIALDQLPRIDLVLISHNHYDSLDVASVRALHARAGGAQTLFVVPLGLKDWFTDLGITHVVELDWWQTHQASALTVTAVPAQHWSKRTLFGRNETLWEGFVVQAERFRFYFAGDSGYSPDFKLIGERLGPFDLAAIPIGAYEPRWFMRHHHMNPEEAVQVHRDVRARRSVGVHWGTFVLSDEPLDEPPLRLAQARQAARLPADAFRVLEHGETIRLDTGQ